MKLITVELVGGERGAWRTTETDVPGPDTPQQRRINAMAEAYPGRIVVGWKVNRPAVEEEAYLDQLSGG